MRSFLKMLLRCHSTVLGLMKSRVAISGLDSPSPIGETGTQMFKALHEEGRMLVYGSLTGEPIRMGEDPRYILSGRRVLEVFWLGYWLPRLEETARNQLADDVVSLIHSGILKTHPGHAYSLNEIIAATTQAESTGRQGKVILVPWKR